MDIACFFTDIAFDFFGINGRFWGILDRDRGICRKMIAGIMERSRNGTSGK
jgi:hypothetical protein